MKDPNDNNKEIDNINIDPDLTDHHDPESPFRFDLGGEG